jgi:hypothetical protein
VESENTESWLWFFRQIKIAIVKEWPNMCIIHDRHAGILKAVKTGKEASSHEETSWHDLQSRWCIKHLGINFSSQFRSKDLMNLFKKLCKQDQEWKYAFLRQKMHDFTGEHVKRKAAWAAAVGAHAALVAAQQGTTLPPKVEPVGLCNLPGFDP